MKIFRFIANKNNDAATDEAMGVLTIPDTALLIHETSFSLSLTLRNSVWQISVWQFGLTAWDVAFIIALPSAIMMQTT